MKKEFDIVISGGGLSGALMALSLIDCENESGQPLSIAIVEAKPVLKDPTLTFDDRVLALSHGTATYLQNLGVWQQLKRVAEPIKNIHISDRGFYGKARLYGEHHQVNALGFVVEMSLIGQVLLAHLKEKNQLKCNLTWFTPDKITDITWQKNQVELTLNSEIQLSAKLLLACDGVHSACRQFANISVQESDYGQSALITNVSTAIAHNNLAFERFTETGPIAMLPLSKQGSVTNDSRCSLVWTLPPEQASRMATLSETQFKEELESAFGSWLGAITQVGKRDVYPLKLLMADEQVFHRMALIGNASHTIHPIAGQGFNLGVRDVKQMAELIKQSLKNNQDVGQFSALSDYASQRKYDHQHVIGLTDSLVTLFSNTLPPLVAGRNVGLKVMNYLSPLKNTLVRKTMGY
ncbi:MULTISPECIES: 2-octaprenyl-6-methoxyphenyl hydroxylase [unclassified Colwellia]|uniref:2-octaprenyl-6-methoxyphenyl hydroxylase n=1 Tax=unclassified Colwellia TaxID=196834 RepID=UPI0015F46B9F|nr:MULTISPECIES: 2-octaprenyl-6-methoxyphenyl hydroxylase [unclassified Colwellia]MBA6231694.1 2-octaprenyl-6-methoxyphenyl hydroxylase [Colwellia sp. MB02u-7]MBA6235558.1 2-octaprenyl-6-methoxyphenyl hydroxylase [Colwellia sp. MB02u-11]MBA6254929.1 2-octaprenyl-6-methoxyphenyl hydroxylase [Colwellia sp. MB3u-28]MBA6259711.1 2-octaprenyl-6-methoxyphenyl hydroxylase [Colwellia sp. MB3u-41]MBA6300282.1 2-octaprenyl-6-methoxyphenyl hydroxylase [Colwellia sp. MB3u-22]